MTPRKIRIRSPYYGAGSPKQFSWTKDNFHIYGVGVNVKYLNDYDVLEIVLEGKSTLVKTQDIKNFANKYNSYKPIKNSMVKVAIFSISLLDPNLHAKKKEIKKEVDTRQPKLF
jgi:hypothetical protein